MSCVCDLKWHRGLATDWRCHLIHQTEQLPFTSNNWTQKDHNICRWKFRSWLRAAK